MAGLASTSGGILDMFPMISLLALKFLEARNQDGYECARLNLKVYPVSQCHCALRACTDVRFIPARIVCLQMHTNSDGDVLCLLLL